jgi:succinate dehydrogenase/fumarate reductase flavoprotein subunit
VILTAGAQAFKSHYAYQKMVTGDAHVMGLRAGAELTNYEFCCHHLACAHFDTTGMNVLQGVGAKFVNAHGEPFMEVYDPEYVDHAAMNRLSAAMASEVRKGNGPIYFDFSGFDRKILAYFNKTLPIMYRAFERAGTIRNGKIKEKVEWVSVNMGNVGYGGGLRVNTDCETSLKGLYAAGDATCGPASGVEGYCAYAIPFAVTSGARSGRSAAGHARSIGAPNPDEEEIRRFSQELTMPLGRSRGITPGTVVRKVQALLFPMDVYIFRHRKRLERALNRMTELRQHLVPCLRADDPHHLRMLVEASNMAVCGELFLRAALKRTESRGSHLREDYPKIDNMDWLKWIILREDTGRIVISTEGIPVDSYPIKPVSKRSTHPIIRIMAANQDGDYRGSDGN